MKERGKYYKSGWHNGAIFHQRKKYLPIIRIDKHATREEMARQTNVSLSTVKRSINKLKAGGLIEYEGPSKGGYWIIKQKKIPHA